MDQALGIGIIGCGKVAASYFNAIPRFKGLEIRACADLNRGMAERFGQDHGVRATTVSDLLHAGDVDLVVNLTSADAHYAVGWEVLRSRKHLFSEKPLTLTFAQAEALQKFAVENRRGIGVAPNTFLTPAYQTARLMLQLEQIGQVNFATCHVMNRGAELRHHNPQAHYLAGQGPLTHQGPYCISTLVALFGSVETVCAVASSPQSRRRGVTTDGALVEMDVDCDTTFQALLSFRNGMQVSLVLSWDVWGPAESGIRVFGTHGTLELPDPTTYEGEVVLNRVDEGTGLVSPTVVPSTLAAPTDLRAEDFYRGLALADMARALREGGSYRCSDYLAVHVVEVLEGIEHAAREGRRVVIGTDCCAPDPIVSAEIDRLLA
ncbi:Gfo/Idh/MocA family protein [Roseibium aestuarii]|uniref:Gfo/Idh/MocA family protein n=1 Tax=Roseibium aestuarii TaxID=2600299 RepID=A0ABW4JSV5_9HYPH|nr:Gfo/Idh/MocA family oxidoreductase [Roseibium aestuarii]